MKLLFALQSFFLLPCFCISVTAQKYSTARDTGKLNIEYNKVSKEIDALKVDLTNEQNKLSQYRDRAKGLEPVAENATNINNQSNGKGIGSNPGQANETRVIANQSINEPDARNAQKEVEKQQIKVDKISRQIEKKQSRLQQLIDMRYKIDFMTRPFS